MLSDGRSEVRVATQMSASGELWAQVRRTSSMHGAGYLAEARAAVLPTLSQSPASLQLPGSSGVFGGDSPSDGSLGYTLAAPPAPPALLVRPHPDPLPAPPCAAYIHWQVHVCCVRYLFCTRGMLGLQALDVQNHCIHDAGLPASWLF